jgi:hypothetical protein
MQKSDAFHEVRCRLGHSHIPKADGPLTKAGHFRNTIQARKLPFRNVQNGYPPIDMECSKAD